MLSFCTNWLQLNEFLAIKSRINKLFKSICKPGNKNKGHMLRSYLKPLNGKRKNYYAALKAGQQ
jgi:hypothetical protein